MPAKHRHRCAGRTPSSLLYREVPIPDPSPTLPGTLLGNCSLGQLTSQGFAQLTALGRAARAKYVDRLALLPEFLDASKIYVRASDFERTKLSAQALLLGLYPEASRAAGAPSIIDIHVAPPASEILYPDPARCPRLAEIAEAALASDTAAAASRKLCSPVEERLERLFSPDAPKDRLSPEQLADVLAAREARAAPLPKGIDASAASQVAACVNWRLNVTLGDGEFLALGIGAFVAELGRAVEEAVGLAGTSAPQPASLRLYSAHDSTLSAVLAAFGVGDGGWPPFASHLAMELFHRPLARPEQAWFFRLLYNGKALLPKGCKDEICGIQVLRDTVLRLNPTTLSCKKRNH